MRATRSHIRRVVIAALEETLAGSHKERIDGKASPIKDLGLKSADGLDFACTLSEKLGFEIDDKINPFVDDSGNRARSVSEIVDLTFDLVAQQEEVSNA